MSTTDLGAQWPRMDTQTEVVLDRQSEAARLLFGLENALRGLVIRELERFGPKWWKQRIPPDIRENATIRSREDAAAPLDAPICHPVCYTDFPDLRKILVRRDNWQECFRRILGRRECVESEFGQIDVPRNRLAHNRYVSAFDYRCIASACSFLLSRVDRSQVSDLVATAIRPFHPRDSLRGLTTTMEVVAAAVDQCTEAEWPEAADATLSAWWFDRDTVDVDTDAIAKACHLLKDYCQCPRYRGMGPECRDWANSVGLQQAVATALVSLSKLRREDGL